MSDTKPLGWDAEEARCYTCEEMGLTGEMIHFEGRWFHEDCAPDLARCPWCGEGGERREMVMWQDGFYHPACVNKMYGEEKKNEQDG